MARNKLAPMSIHVANDYVGGGYTVTVCPQSHSTSGTDTCAFRSNDGKDAGRWHASNDAEIVTLLAQLISATMLEQLTEGRGQGS